jgi:hypothetical protein
MRTDPNIGPGLPQREPWRAASLYHPSGRKLVEIRAKPHQIDGLTELFFDRCGSTSGA